MWGVGVGCGVLVCWSGVLVCWCVGVGCWSVVLVCAWCGVLVLKPPVLKLPVLEPKGARIKLLFIDSVSKCASEMSAVSRSVAPCRTLGDGRSRAVHTRTVLVHKTDVNVAITSPG